MISGNERETPRRRALMDVVLPSRAAALKALRSALLAQQGPVLITGEPGAGKTWLSRRLEAELPYPWRWARVDLTPATDPGDLLRAVARAVGSARPSQDADRWAHVDTLLDSAAEDERWVLVVEEAHNASEAVWEELRVLANHLGEPDGFAGIVLIGQTPLARRLGTRPFAALGVRLACVAHLKPLDRDEALRFLDATVPGWSGGDRLLDELHRDAEGNPRRLARVAERPGIAAATAPPVARRPADPGIAPTYTTAPARTFPAEPERPVPIPVPAKPPLHEEEGLIEVGWDPSDPESDPGDDNAVAAALAPDLAPADGLTTEEPINDHYAALQAWSEWATNQGRAPAAAVIGNNPATANADAEEPDAEPVAPSGHPSVWAEGQHGFAPYSQLFTRLRQTRDS